MDMRRTPWLVLLVAGASVAGCFEMEADIVLRADGSGTQRLEVQMSPTAVATLKGAAYAVDASAQRSDPTDLFDARKVRAELEAAGLSLEEHRTFEERDKRCVELKARFSDLDGLRKNPLTGGERATWQVTRGAGRDEVRLVYFPRGQQAWKDARAKARELASEPDEVVQKFFASRLQQLEGLRVVFSLELPGDIIAHTANLKLDGKRKVQASIAAEDVRSVRDLLMLVAPRFEVVFACAGFPVGDSAPSEASGAAAQPAPARVPARAR